MFNESWISLSILLILIALVLSQGELILLSVLLLTIIPTSWMWNRYVLRGLRVERILEHERVFAGDTTHVTIRVTNRKILPVAWLKLEDNFPQKLIVQGRELSPSSEPLAATLTIYATLRWYERVSWTYTLACPQRGFYFFGPTHRRSGDLFGLFMIEDDVPLYHRLIVYPQVQPLEAFGLPPRNPLGEQRARYPLFEDPSRTVGIRGYTPDDPFRRIHWKASARQQALQVRVYEPSETAVVGILLNVATYEQFWLGIDTEVQEAVIRLAASLAYEAFQEGYAVGLIANGAVPQSDRPIKVLPSRESGQLARVLEALAAVSSFALGHIDRLVAQESRSLPWGTTLVVITAIVRDNLLLELARLIQAGRRVVLISLDIAPSSLDLPGALVYDVSQSMIYREADSAARPINQANRPPDSSGTDSSGDILNIWHEMPSKGAAI
ncbi:MAG: DUF58 domain-containing protein [Chloroflexi bacterium]|nr:DUF58 domain-containing protein [Chloroflexota bacterium]